MELGLFQLENLLISRSPFLFLDLRTKEQIGAKPLPPELQKHLEGAVNVSPVAVTEHLRRIQHEVDRPLVLICQDGESSRRLAVQLEAGGFKNVYIIADGVVGLLSES